MKKKNYIVLLFVSIFSSMCHNNNNNIERIIVKQVSKDIYFPIRIDCNKFEELLDYSSVEFRNQEVLIKIDSLTSLLELDNLNPQVLDTRMKIEISRINKKTEIICIGFHPKCMTYNGDFVKYNQKIVDILYHSSYSSPAR